MPEKPSSSTLGQRLQEGAHKNENWPDAGFNEAPAEAQRLAWPPGALSVHAQTRRLRAQTNRSPWVAPGAERQDVVSRHFARGGLFPKRWATPLRRAELFPSSPMARIRPKSRRRFEALKQTAPEENQKLEKRACCRLLGNSSGLRTLLGCAPLCFANPDLGGKQRGAKFPRRRAACNALTGQILYARRLTSEADPGPHLCCDSVRGPKDIHCAESAAAMGRKLKGAAISAPQRIATNRK